MRSSNGLDAVSSANLMERLCALYDSFGYDKYKMSKFEEYELYVRNKGFLVSESIISFTDTDGKLMALKPDVTLSIIKNCRDIPDTVQKLYYNESVYRVQKSTRSYREIMQTGLECIGAVDQYTLCEVLYLAAASLRLVDPGAVLDVSHVGILTEAFDELEVPETAREPLVRLIGDRNLHGLTACCAEAGLTERAAKLLSLFVTEYGPAGEVLPVLAEAFGGLVDGEKFSVLGRAADFSDGGKDGVRIDFSVIGDTRYYDGIVFKGFLPGAPESVLSGGQYGGLMRSMGKTSDALGFAVYVDEIAQSRPVRKDYDCDVLILYGDGTDPDEIRAAGEKYRKEAGRVRAERHVEPGFRARKTVDLTKERREEP